MSKPSLSENVKALDAAIDEYAQLPNTSLAETIYIGQKSLLIRKGFDTAIASMELDLESANKEDEALQRLGKLSKLLQHSEQLHALNRKFKAINENFLSHLCHTKGLSMPQSST